MLCKHKLLSALLKSYNKYTRDNRLLSSLILGVDCQFAL